MAPKLPFLIVFTWPHTNSICILIFVAVSSCRSGSFLTVAVTQLENLFSIAIESKIVKFRKWKRRKIIPSFYLHSIWFGIVKASRLILFRVLSSQLPFFFIVFFLFASSSYFSFVGSFIRSLMLLRQSFSVLFCNFGLQKCHFHLLSCKRDVKWFFVPCNSFVKRTVCHKFH